MSTATETATPIGTGSGISSRHPRYNAYIEDWSQLRDTYRGERVVKEAGSKYLPPTSGMLEDGFGTLATSAGQKAYDAYRKRARFPDIVREAVEAMIGVMHHKPPSIELPDSLEPMRLFATLRGESLEMLLRRVNEEQLVTGRLGLLLDLPARETKDPGVTPYIAVYGAERCINWDEGRRDGIVVDNLNLVVLDESEYERGRNFSWDLVQKYRVLTLNDPNDLVEGTQRAENQPMGEGVYKAAVYRQEAAQFSAETLVEPMLRGTSLTEIPFVFINSKDVVPEPEGPPLLGLSDLALGIYRGEADYRQALFLQGQDTLVVTGGSTGEDEQMRVGANARINLPVGGDAKFIGVDSAGLSEMREALQNDRQQAASKGGQLLDTVSREKESGDALKIRVAARTATLNSIALAGAFGLEQLLKSAARWIGADPEMVKVEPNLDFVDDRLGGEELVKLMTAKMGGAPHSLRSIHALMSNRGLTEMTFEDELREIANEEPLMQGSNNLGDPEEDDIDEPEPDEDE